jgi:crotonobetainyl-CoA:carnitine CoA-transferase CaiB-like acyl-CoA transferase/pimeloyl-ACP methyl ester carboxylesterase
VTAGALAGVSVLDLSDTVAGQFCGRLFADNGAETLLGEPEAGSPTRRMGPFAAVAGKSERASCLFSHLNAGKASVVVDLDSPSGRARAAELAAAAHVIVGDLAGRARAMAEEAGTAVLCDVTPFGRDGPRREWQGSELVYQALSGVMFENGQPDREPLYGVGQRASYAAGVIGYLQCVAALLAGAACVVDVSIAEVAASMNFNRATQFSYNRVIEDRDQRTIPRALVRCVDGWMSLFIYDHRWAQSCRALGLDDLIDDPRFADEQTRLLHWEEFLSALQERLHDRPVDEVVEAGQREKVVVARSTSPLALRSDPQLCARGFWDRCAPGELPRLGPMFGFVDTPQVDAGGAPPRPGATNAARTGRKPPVWLTAVGGRRRRGPLEGTRILDLTTAWSGPMATRLLAALGADVLKVEGPSRIDDWRGPVDGGLPSRYPDRDPGSRPYDRCYQFNTQNHDKRSLVLDLKSDAGHGLALGLAAEVDVLIANFSAGTLERMGLGWPTLHDLNPRLILVEMPAYGSTGPMAGHVALGPSMELTSGMASSIGYGDGRPVTTGPAYLDPIGGFNAAAAVVTALAARETTGRGQHVEIAQREAAMQWIGELVVHAIAAGADSVPRGNRLADVVPHGAFPCLGFDEWVAIAAPSDEAFAALCGAMGVRRLAADPAFATVAARTANEDEIERRVSDWTRTRDKHDVAETLQAAGVPAAPVCNARDLAESRFLRARGLLQEATHPVAGTHLHQGLPLHMSGWNLSIRVPAPRFGEHSEDLLRERLRLSDDDLDRLRTSGVTAREPVGVRRGRARPAASGVELAEVIGGDGVRLHVRTAGPREAPPIVFVHGWSQSALAWKHQFAKPLLDEFRLVAFDLRGHGMSERPLDAAAYASRSAWADDVAAVVEQLELCRPVLVGWSFGGYVVCDYLRCYGAAEIAGVNFVGWAVMMGDDERVQALIGPAFFDHFDGAVADDLATSIAAMRGFIRACVATELDQDELEEILAYNMIVPPFVRRAMAMCPPVDNSDVLAALTVPVLLSYGLDDQVTRRTAADHILGCCQTARASFYAGIGHSPFLEDPRRFNLELADFATRANRDCARALVTAAE